MTEDRLLSLISRQVFGDLEPEEILELEQWANETDLNRDFLTRFSDETVLRRAIHLWVQIDPAEGFSKWKVYRRQRRGAKIVRFTGWSVAASLLIAFVIGDLIEKKVTTKDKPAIAITTATSPVMPGRTTATLTLANGKTILLDSVGKGELARQGGTRLIKAGSGTLAYLAEYGEATAVTFNILTTPRSGQYQLTLPDGSRVWLNNVSRLRYPTAFLGKDRTVELTGEAYFEIVKDAAKPFIVKVKDEAVEVLGTSFNVMAYSEEGGTQTTLLTGAVAVKAGSNMVRLKPDEQAQMKADGGLKVVKDVASQDVVSWKDGFFYFGRASFAAVMRQLARWYDVDVIYEGKVPEMEFGGKIDRTLPLNDLLKFLDKNQIHFRLEGRKLIVLPN